MLHHVFDHLRHPHLSDEDRATLSAALSLLVLLLLAGILFDIFVHLHDFGA